MKKQIIVITGGTTGIGFACAEYLLSLDYTVIITGRTKENLDTAVFKLGENCVGILSDTSSLSDIDELVLKIKSQFGKIDGLFINAGIFTASNFEETSEELFDETMNINFKGAFFTIQKFIPILKNPPSSIVLNTSIVVFKSFANTSVYTASKSALESIAKVLNVELADRGIRVNIVSPGGNRKSNSEKVRNE
ncbi:short-chain dehydrogenase [Algibacter lectus]|uniref:Short-chain dehydrogenase n=1 Tax=Algibacter lectus TaxID=221126 RepID=A0A090WZX7_9FLAO|nr:SDR family NAD(P)-dependent oxidoreductase [Algibacter lectus]GAL82486.1 short-chain dehydrogenase [Algibacter lectus]